MSQQMKDAFREATESGQPVVTRRRALSCQVCVRCDWTDGQIVAFANRENPAGTENGWQIRREGDEALCGDPERRQCEERPAFVHVMLDC